MKNKTYSFYEPTTGMLRAKKTSCHPEDISKNTPSGWVAIEGVFDHLSQRVDLASGQVVDWQPPQPSDQHEWDIGVRRWVKKSEAVRTEAEKTKAQATIGGTELRSLRAMREALLELLAPDSPSRTRLQEADDAIKTVRLGQE